MSRCTNTAVLAAVFSVFVAAQDTTVRKPGRLPKDQDNEASRTVPGTAQNTSRPLTVRQKFQYRLSHTFDPWELLRGNLAAGFDQWRDYPEEWGQGWDAYGVRFASAFGQHLIKEQLMFGVEVIDHEDPRRPRSENPTFKGRVLDAVKYTFIARSDSGRMMPAYSRFVGAYGAAFISRYGWYPAEFRNAATPLKAGTTTLAIDAGMNVLRELWHHYK
jgi:hypothetical protein